MKPTKLSELIDALDFDSSEHTHWVDRQNGCVVMLDNTVRRAVEEEDEAVLSRLADWQKPEVAIARAIVDQRGGRFVVAPAMFDFHEYGHMAQFIRTVADVDAAEQLRRAIKGKGAFRHFKNTAARLGVLHDWFRFRDDAMKRFVVAWADAKGVPYEDNLKPRKA
ncbi:hypothetical protein LBMAG56_15350 [Verrucomicrobiota bacterium]|nr:hypothetical protein LBMAG56_15350 [Verrucomicrobiota bacterium]